MAQLCAPASSPFRRPRAARHHGKSYSSHAFYPGSAHRLSVHKAEPLFHTALPLSVSLRVRQVPPRRALFPVLEHRVQQLPLPCAHLHSRKPHMTPVLCNGVTAPSTQPRTRPRPAAAHSPQHTLLHMSKDA